MGETTSKHTLKKSKDNLKDDVVIVNKITSNDLFKRRTGYTLTFYFHGAENILVYVISESNRLGEVAKINNLSNIVDSKNTLTKARFDLKRLKLNYTQFYNFYNTLLNSLSIFYEEKYRGKKITPNKGEDTQELCCICDEKLSNVMLKCYVKPFLKEAFLL